MRKLTHNDVLRILPDRACDAHKGNFGRVLLLCGSRGYTGAAALAAMGALRTGSGLVYLGVPDSVYGIIASKLLEPVVFPLPDEEGMFATTSIKALEEKLQAMDAVLIGPGIGMSPGTWELTKYVLENFSGPVVLDADGINSLSTHKNILRDRTGITIITPHEGEFCRLGGNLTIGRLNAANQLSKDLGCIVVLKGHETIITDGLNEFINPTGNPGMAVGGCGDILAGMIVSLLGQKIDAITAAATAVWLHGAAGDVCASMIGQYGMLPSDILQVLPRLMK